MAIKKYIKDNKTMYRVYNHYIGTYEFNGKEKRLYKMGFSSKKEAELYIATEKIKFETNKYSPNALRDDIKFQKLTELWYEQHKMTIRETSRVNIKNTLKVINAYFPNYEVKKITLPMVQDLINKTANIYSKSYIGKIKATMGAILDYAVKCDLVVKNVAKMVNIPTIKKDTKEKGFYTKEELKEFLKIVKENYDLKTFLLFRLLAYTGARKSEITALCWSDIDFKNNTININKTHSYNENYGVCINEPKTKSSKRIISIDNETIAILKSYKISQKVFNIKANLFDVKYINFFNQQLRKIYNNFPHLKRITPHGFRHTHASLLFESGASFKEVQERLGHSDIKMTMNIYTHVSNKQKENTANNFARFMIN